MRERADGGLALRVTYPFRQGSVAERPNALALKASVGKTTGGSNPSASAEEAELRGIQRGIFVPLRPTQLNLISANDGSK